MHSYKDKIGRNFVTQFLNAETATFSYQLPTHIRLINKAVLKYVS